MREGAALEPPPLSVAQRGQRVARAAVWTLADYLIRDVDAVGGLAITSSGISTDRIIR